MKTTSNRTKKQTKAYSSATIANNTLPHLNFLGMSKQLVPWDEYDRIEPCERQHLSSDH